MHPRTAKIFGTDAGFSESQCNREDLGSVEPWIGEIKSLQWSKLNSTYFAGHDRWKADAKAAKKPDLASAQFALRPFFYDLKPARGIGMERLRCAGRVEPAVRGARIEPAIIAASAVMIISRCEAKTFRCAARSNPRKCRSGIPIIIHDPLASTVV